MDGAIQGGVNLLELTTYAFAAYGNLYIQCFSRFGLLLDMYIGTGFCNLH